MSELNSALGAFDKDPSLGAAVITGSERAFVAGADIKEMKDKTFSEAYGEDFIESWSEQVSQIQKPIISAVNGFALGGGCEIAMMADILYCSVSATFGQPEIKLGVIPGAGGSQRLRRAIGKSRAMELILTGKDFSGKEAGEWGLAARVFESAQECVDGAVETAEKIAGYSRITVKAAKEVVNKSQDLGIREGVEYERRVFHGLFGSRDQKIGRLSIPWIGNVGVLILAFRYGGFCAEKEARLVTWLKCLPFLRNMVCDVHMFNHKVSGVGSIKGIISHALSHEVSFCTVCCHRVSTRISNREAECTYNQPIHSFINAPSVHGRTSHDAPVPVP